MEDAFRRELPRLEPIVVEVHERLIVEKLLRKKNDQKGGVLFEVKWKGFDQRTWEPRASLLEDLPQIVAQFERKSREGRARDLL